MITFRTKRLAVSLVVLFVVLLPFFFLHHEKNGWFKKSDDSKTDDMQSCKTLLAQWNTNISVLLIDLDFLNGFNDSNCQWNTRKPITIGIDMKYQSIKPLYNDHRFKVVHYSNNASKDFLDFDLDGRRLIPKRFPSRWIGNIEIPANTLFAEFWKRSKFVDCVGLKLQRNETEKVYMPGQPSSDKLSRIRDELIDNGMFPFLSSGTFLGWYRECSFIPHTQDMDLAVLYDNYNPAYLKKLENHETNFKIVRRFGMASDSLEMTVVPKKEGGPRIDIFIMYDGVENGTITHSYISGLDEDGTKYKWSNPIYDPWCAAELHNHVFWVSCSPRPKIIYEFGEYWFLDKPTSKYSWNRSSNNVKPYGKFTKEQMKEAHIIY